MNLSSPLPFAWQRQATPTWTSCSGSWGTVIQNDNKKPVSPTERKLRTPESWSLHDTAGGTTAETQARGKGNSSWDRHLPHINGNEMLLSHLPLPDPWFQAKSKLRSPDWLCLQIPINPSPHKASRFLPKGVGHSSKTCWSPAISLWCPNETRSFRSFSPAFFFKNQSDRVLM